MGIIVENYTTSEGFQVPELYVQVNSIRILKTLNGGNYGCVYSSSAYKSFNDKEAGCNPLPIPTWLANVEEVLTANQFYEQTVFGFAYDCIKRAWQAQGYVVQDYYPHPPTPKTYTYDCSGYNFQGFNCAGYDREGYDKDGFNAAGWDRQGYGRDGYNAAGYDRQGFNRQGYDIDGYDRDGYNAQGYDRQGYNRQGYDAEGYDRQGYDAEGYDRNGYDRQGCNRQHQDINGNPCPDISGNLIDVSGNQVDASGNQVDVSGNPI
jgi:hypothetical protein